MESENPLTSIEQWYRRATALDRNWRESRREEVSGAVHTRVEVHRMDSKMSGLVERPWLQLMCCAVCLPRGRNFR